MTTLESSGKGDEILSLLFYSFFLVIFATFPQDREAASARVLKETGPNSYLVPPYDHKHIIAGQGTMALELLDQVYCHVLTFIYDV